MPLREDLSNPEFEALWLLIKPRRLPRGINSIVLGAIYHPQNSDNRAMLAYSTESLDRALTANPGAAIILTGDFNQFKHRQLCNSFSLKQIVKNATRGSNILDKMFTNISKFYDVPEIVPPLGFSDHKSVLLSPLNHRRNSRSFRMVRDACPSNRRLITEALSSVNWSPMYHLSSCDEQFQYFSSIVDGIVDKYLPLKRIKSDSSDKTWITPEIKRLISKRQVTWRKGNKPMFRFYRNKINNLCRRARSKYYTNNVANTTQSNPRKWWSAVKNIAGLAPSKNVSTLVYNGQPYSDSALANLFNDKFVAVGNSLPPLAWTPLEVGDFPPDFYISIDDIEKALQSVKSFSAAGPDEITPWFLRENSSLLCRPLASIFNASIHPCGNLQMSFLQQSLPLLWMLTLIFDRYRSRP